MNQRISIYRKDADGSVVDGTASFERTADGVKVHDFRGLDGEEMELPPGSTFVIDAASIMGTGGGHEDTPHL